MDNKRKYYVCINFGNEETTASFIDLTASYPVNREGIYDVPKLNILNGSTDEARTIESIICRGKDNQWRFATDLEDFSHSDLLVRFKAKIEDMSTDDKEHYKVFINLVFKAIIARNNFLQFDENNPKNRNFELCIAYPSTWGTGNKDVHNTVIESYKNFFSKSLPIPIKFVIRENDAVVFKYIHWTNQNIKKILIIDLRSNTINFTYYPHKDSEDYPKGTTNGSNHIACAIQDWCAETQTEYKEAKLKLPIILSEFNDIHPNWEMRVRQYIKEMTEDFYERNRKSLCLNIPASMLLGDSISDKLIEAGHCGDILHHCKIGEDLLYEILANYRSNLREDLSRVHNSGATPEMILLTDGASQMPWVKKLVKDIFQGAQVFYAPNSSYDVSDGIAMYAYANHKFRTTIETELTEEELIEILIASAGDQSSLNIYRNFIIGNYMPLQALILESKIQKKANTPSVTEQITNSHEQCKKKHQID